MKKYEIAILAMILSMSVYSQTKEDYIKTLSFISKSFNEKKASLIHQKFSPDLKNELQEVDFKSTIDSLYTEKGKISSYDLIMEEEGEKSYLVEFENSSMLLLINLSKGGQISLFKINEY